MSARRSLPQAALARRKRALRAEYKAIRDALTPAERADASARIRARVLALPELRAASSVLLYVPVGSEVDIFPLAEPLTDAGKTVCLPRCAAGHTLILCRYRPGDELVCGAYNIPEPAPDAAVLRTVGLILAPAGV